MSRTIAAIAGVSALIVAVVAAGYSVAGWAGMMMAATAFAGLVAYVVTRREHLVFRWLGAHSEPKPVHLVSANGGRVAAMGQTLAQISQRAGIVPPRLGVVDADQVNAFAIDLSNQKYVFVTRGFIDALDDEQAKALLTLQVARIVDGVARRASIAALVSGSLAQVGALRMAGRADSNANPFAMPGATLLAPLGALVYRALVSKDREQIADAQALSWIGQPKALIRAMERAEFTAHALPLSVPAALGGMAVVNPLLGAPDHALARLYGMGTPVAHRFPSWLKTARERPVPTMARRVAA